MPISNTPKPAYIYKNGTWYPISAPVNTAANYDWSGSHVFASSVTFDEVLRAEGGVNNFQNPAERDTYMQSPANGTVVFIRQDENSNQINQIQYYQNGSWINHNNISISEKTTSYTIGKQDADKLLKINSSSNLEVIVPNDLTVDFPIGFRLEIYRAGSGEVAIAAASGSGVTIRSKNNNLRIAAQYSGVLITKIGANEWHLIGDLKA